MNCIFCGKDNATTSFRKKPICSDCFEEISWYGKNTKYSEALMSIQKKIERVIEKELGL